MKTRTTRCKRMAAFFFAVLMAALCLPLGAAANETGEDFKKVETHYDIAVVFDNSLSMFYDNPNGGYEYIPRWSRAKFAMEIFASMLDLNGGDSLTIFPMWKVVYTGEKPPFPEADKNKEAKSKYYAGENDRVEIKGPGDIDNITKMYTLFAGGTPFDPVESALKYLKGLPGEENRTKWLIVLTDGDFDEYHGADLAPNEGEDTFNVSTEITKIGAEGINVQFLSIDPKTDEQKAGDKKDKAVKKVTVTGSDGENGSPRFFIDEARGAGIQDKLIEICNRIFQRDKLPSGDISGTSLQLGISMRRVIVFVQGEGVQIEGLQDAGGNRMNVVSDSRQRKYSDFTFGGNEYKNIGNGGVKTDTSLYGQVVTFSDCPAGNYTLSVNGSVNSDTLQVFYEPNVRVKTELFREGSDVPFKDGDKIYKGEYIVKCSIVDGVDGNDVSDSPLLGDGQAYKIKVTNNGKTVDVENEKPISLVPDEGDAKTTIDVEFSYLKGKYTIRNTDSPWSTAGGGFSITDDPPPPPPPKMTLEFKDVEAYYKIPDHEKWKPVRVNVRLVSDGKKSTLTPEQMNELKVTLSSKEKKEPNASMSQWKVLPEESAIEIYLYKDANGGYLGNPDTGNERITVKCELTIIPKADAEEGSYGTEFIKYDPQQIEADEAATFEFTTMDKWLQWIIRIASLLAVIALILWFMSRKVLPKDVKATQQIFKTSEAMMEGQGKASLERKAKKIKVASPPADEAMNCRISFEVVPVSRRWTRSKDRAYQIVRIFGGASTVDKIEINAIGYVKSDKGGFVSEDNPDMPLKINPRSTYNVTIFAEEAQLECKIVNK